MSFKIQRRWARIILEAKIINYQYNAPTTNQMETELNAIMQKDVNAKGDKKCQEKMVKQLQKENEKSGRTAPWKLAVWRVYRQTE